MSEAGVEHVIVWSPSLAMDDEAGLERLQEIIEKEAWEAGAYHGGVKIAHGAVRATITSGESLFPESDADFADRLGKRGQGALSAAMNSNAISGGYKVVSWPVRVSE